MDSMSLPYYPFASMDWRSYPSKVGMYLCMYAYLLLPLVIIIVSPLSYIQTQYMTADIIAGLTVAIMVVPQGR